MMPLSHGRSCFAASLALLVCWATASAAVDDAAPAAEAGAEGADGKGNAKPGLAALVRINLPLKGGSDAALKHSISRARDRLVEQARHSADGRRPTLVLEIVPAASDADHGAGSAFEPVLSLARVLASRELADVRTVAWLPRSIRGHGVLAALACEEIVMAPDAEIGEAGVDEAKNAAVSRTVVEAYREIAEVKRTMPATLAVSMVDPDVEVVKVESEEGLRFLTREELKEYRTDHEIISDEVLVPAGALGRFTGREGRQYGFVKYLAGDRAALARALAVPVEALDEDQSLATNWKPIVLDLKGEITPRTASEFKTLLTNHVSGGANWVCIRIDSVGGDVEACLDIAATLAALDPNAVRSVAYVPVEARGGAAIVALACDQLAMHEGAKIGAGPDAQVPPPPAPFDNRRLPPPGPKGPQPAPPARDMPVNLDAAVASIRDSLAPRTERSWSLMAAMIDPGVEVLRYRNKTSGDERLMSAQEAAALPDAVDWTRGAPLVAGNHALEFDGKQALDQRLAAHVVGSFDELKRLFAIDDVEEVRSNWALALVQALASPGLATFLLFLGFIGLYIELKTPGVGLGGIVAALAFALFFWSKYLNGTAEALEIVMFIGGLVLLLIEIFVLPGFGLFGLSGALLVIFSLVLASQTFVVPHSQADMDRLRSSIAIVVGAGLGMVALAFATRRYLPKAPLFNKMVLGAPPPEERVTLSSREALADYTHLLGAVGEAVTDLAPTGRALIGDELIDVIVLGDLIDRGTPVEVVSAHANRVIVRRAT